jgi:hypothetical protein
MLRFSDAKVSVLGLSRRSLLNLRDTLMPKLFGLRKNQRTEEFGVTLSQEYETF